MLADMSTPNGQAVPQGPKSPSGKSLSDTRFLQTAAHLMIRKTVEKPIE